MTGMVDNIKTGLKGIKGAGDVIRGTALQAADEAFDRDPNHPKTAAKHEKNRQITEQGKAHVRDLDVLVGRRERDKIPASSTTAGAGAGGVHENVAPYEEPAATTGPVDGGRHGSIGLDQQTGVTGTTGAHGNSGLHQDSGIPGSARPTENTSTYGNTGLHQDTSMSGTTGPAYGQDPMTHTQKEIPPAKPPRPTQQETFAQQEDMPSFRTQEEGLAQREPAAFRPHEGGSGYAAQQEFPAHQGETAYPARHEMPPQNEMPVQQQGVPSYPARQAVLGEGGLPMYQTQQRSVPAEQETGSSYRPQQEGLGGQKMAGYLAEQGVPGQQHRPL